MFHLCSINTVNWSSRNIYFSGTIYFFCTYIQIKHISSFSYCACLLREKTCQKMTDNAVFEHDQITEETSRNGMSGSNVIAMELIKKQRGATVSFHSIRYRVEQKSGPICRRTTVHKEILVDLKWVNITQTKRVKWLGLIYSLQYVKGSFSIGASQHLFQLSFCSYNFLHHYISYIQ